MNCLQQAKSYYVGIILQTTCC